MIESFLALAVLAIAVSLDGFGVGIAYGLRRIRIPVLSVFIIACCSGFIIWLSMQAGRWLSQYLSEYVTSFIGAIILIVIGSWSIVQYVRAELHKRNGEIKLHDWDGEQEKEQLQDEQVGASSGKVKDTHINQASASPVIMLELKTLGLVIQILRSPHKADIDRSGNISSTEALMLGTALSLDAFGAGLGAAMLGFPALITSVAIALSSAAFLLIGLKLGFRFSQFRQVKVIALLPGILLIAIGFIRLI